MPARPGIAPTEDWRQIERLARAPGQRTDELIRPVVRFGQSAAERAAETGAAERTRSRQVACFDPLGLASLAPPPKVEKHRVLPAEVRQTILAANREHPPLNVHELTTIRGARRGHRPSSHTVKRILAERPPPPRTHRCFPARNSRSCPEVQSNRRVADSM
ncbi:MAG: helix-turn-helix domain-containing protein [Haloechinothrix sp.]